MSKHNSKIIFDITLDQNRIPEEIRWTAKDGGIENEEAKAIMLAIWDNQSKESLRMDLWTKDMPLDEMKMFFYQTFISMADTFQRATADEKMTETIKDFAAYFAEKMEINKN
ncbi:MAG: gliding motility protein GldC [Bacteroidota bacterium]|nr:gliding motility protein GldC [Bacteroidota bacterium]